MYSKRVLECVWSVSAVCVECSSNPGETEQCSRVTFSFHLMNIQDQKQREQVWFMAPFWHIAVTEKQSLKPGVSQQHCRGLHT